MSDFIVPSSPSDQAKLRGMVDELSNTMLRVSSEKALQKDIKDRAKEELGIPPAVLNWMAKQATEDTFDEHVEKEDSKRELYETVMLSNNNKDDGDTDDEDED